jgi:hypothetical protein
MFGLTRAMLTLVGVASAVVLVWLATQIGDDSTADYWALYALVASAGLGMALSQLLGGWTKWGWPRLSIPVLVLGFVPAFVVATWVVAAGQPDENWLQGHVVAWSDDLGLGSVVEDLLDLAGPLAFLAGLTFGFAFDTSGPRRREVAPPAEERTEVREHEVPAEVENGDRETTLTRHAEPTRR